MNGVRLCQFSPYKPFVRRLIELLIFKHVLPDCDNNLVDGLGNERTTRSSCSCSCGMMYKHVLCFYFSSRLSPRVFWSEYQSSRCLRS